VLLLAASAVALTVLVAGCGGTKVDPVKLEDTAKPSLEKSLHEKITAVECPSGQSVDPGVTFSCEVIFPDEKRELVIFKIRNKEADISTIGLEPKD
jgi:hypothetical protein